MVSTLESIGLRAAPYHANVPSFGEWGFVVASRRHFSPDAQAGKLFVDLKFLNPQTLRLLFDFLQDMSRVPVPVNRLSNQELVHSYEREWGKVTH